ncbi:uncharacterized protein TNCV_1074951 [Trichonephila clavipes]|uniref:Transposase n=1 Tax=Trichonephila clavipes TaxID=2585209 RepID=A0A8X6SUR4_TRICX|nr:uncharacterized protein TNCV_1074951 [Trichonephila clavipes]
MPASMCLTFIKVDLLSNCDCAAYRAAKLLLALVTIQLLLQGDSITVTGELYRTTYKISMTSIINNNTGRKDRLVGVRLCSSNCLCGRNSTCRWQHLDTITVTNWLLRGQLCVRRPAAYFLLTPNNYLLRHGHRFNSCQVIYSQFGLAIHQNDHQARRRFVEWAQNEIAVIPDFHKRILFSDEAHFWLNGYVNKQNCRIWSDANPQVYVETPLHPEKLTIWCALWAGGIIDPYFFKNDEGQNVTVNGDRYRAMITNFFIPELNNHDVQELWF